MDCLEAIQKRKSIRKFADKPVPEELLRKVLDAGRLAPTGGNMQPWEFIVVKDRERIKAIVDTTFVGADRTGTSRQTWIETAPLVIAVCANPTRTIAKYGEMGREVVIMDVAAAIENMLLAAVSLGLASCWVAGFHKDALAKVLETPEHIEPLSLLPLGYPAQSPTPRKKFSLEEIVYYETYGKR